MKLQNKHRQLIALIIGIAIVVFGLLQALFRFNIDRKVIDEVTTVLFLAAFVLLFGGRSKKAGDGKTPEPEPLQEGQAGPEGAQAGEDPDAGHEGGVDDVNDVDGTDGTDSTGSTDGTAEDDEQNTKGE